MNERASRVNSAGAGMKPELVGITAGIEFKTGVLGNVFQSIREFRRDILALMDAAELVKQFEGIGLLFGIGEGNDETEVGEIIGHSDLVWIEG